MMIGGQTEPRERRRLPRAPFFGKVALRAASGDVIEAWGENLSEGGILVHTRAAYRLRAGTPVELRLQIPDAGGVVRAVAQVVHFYRGSSVGLRFVGLHAAARRVVSTYVFTGSGRVLDYPC